jgi:uncharacterized lipoprotein YajG
MKNSRMSLSLSAVLLVGTTYLAGCALTTDTVDIQYHSSTAVSSALGADQVMVEVQTVDGRTGRLDQVSSKKNGYGMEMAAILSARPVSEIVRQALAEELHKEGFLIGQSRIVVVAEINKFSNDYKVGFFSSDAVGEVTLAVQVRDTAGHILYTRTLTGQGTNGGVMLMGGENARVSLEAALSSAVVRLMSDQAFTRAIQDAGRAGLGGRPIS